MLAHLTAENTYTAAVLADTEALQSGGGESKRAEDEGSGGTD